MRMKFACLALLLAVVPFHAAHAAEPRIRFVAFDFELPAGDYKIIPATKGKNPVPVAIRLNNFSEPIRLKEDRYRLVSPDGHRDAGFEIRPDEPQRLLFILLPGNDDTLGLVRTSDDLEHFGRGARLVLNLTHGEVRVALGDQRFAIRSGDRHLAKPQPTPRDGRLPVRMFCQVDGEWKLFNSTMWPHDPEQRSIVLIHPSKTRSRYPRVRSLAEVVAGGD